MILKETILSAFTERGTLLKWLKKVEAALNDAVLTDISVDQISETQVKLKFTFENGDYIESPVLTLPRGEKGEKGEDGKDGKDGLDGEGVAATIEVGTVTTGAAGTDASVTNAGTEQHAVLNFVIPRGERGEKGANGEQGSAGVGFEDADGISINDGTLNITAGADGVNIAATFEVAVGNEILEIPATMYLPIKGSDTIVIDVDESGEFIDIHLDAVIAAKIWRALVTPTSAPASLSLVGVNTNNAQVLLTIGEGLMVENGVLKLAPVVAKKNITIKVTSYSGVGGPEGDTIFNLKYGETNTNENIYPWNTAAGVTYELLTKEIAFETAGNLNFIVEIANKSVYNFTDAYYTIDGTDPQTSQTRTSFGDGWTVTQQVALSNLESGDVVWLYLETTFD